MCGILGIVGNDSRALADALARGIPPLRKRGPDSEGSMVFNGAALGHTRLSIIDLVTGLQPMKDHERNLTITFNGEIFNYKSVRRELEQKGYSFVTTSDTEVILKAYREYGDRCPEYLDGQFAFAIWDDDAQRLFLARDRFGEKPLFYSVQNGVFLFSSEIKALLATGLVSNTLDSLSIDNYLSLYFIPPWRTIYRDITPLAPAHTAVFEKGTLTTRRYWELTHAPVSLSYDDAAHEVREMLARSAESRMVADVEVGVFLSGGIDSSIIAALSQKNATMPLKSFAAGFDAQINELPYAKEVAQHIGTDHYERMITVSLQDIRTVTRYYDEPLGDSSNVPTALIAQLAREHVTVTLSGDGGDELFFGYGHYRAHWHLPAYKKALAFLLGYTPEKLYRRSHLTQFSVHERARLWRDKESIEYDPTARIDLSEAITPLQKVSLLDLYLKLPGDMLTKVDRSSMMHSLEVRSPFLNHTLAQFAFNLPDAYKTSRTQGKVILEKACGDLLPPTVFARKKQGFGAPVKHWLMEASVRRAVEEMFVEPRIGAFLHPDRVRTYVDGFYRHGSIGGHKFWMLVALELWMREHEGLYEID